VQGDAAVTGFISRFTAIGAFALLSAATAHAGEPLFFCTSQEDDPRFDSITISTGKSAHIFEGTLRYLNNDGVFIEKSMDLFRVQKPTTDGPMIQFYSSKIQIRLFPAKKLGDTTFIAKLSMPEINLVYSDAACKPL
jgi:hypothetical protein